MKFRELKAGLKFQLAGDLVGGTPSRQDLLRLESVLANNRLVSHTCGTVITLITKDGKHDLKLFP